MVLFNFMRGSVCPTTSKRYGRAWIVWEKHCAKRPAVGKNTLLSGMSRSGQLEELVRFIHYRRVIKMDTFGVVNGYITGLRFEFKCRLAEILCLKDPVIIQALSAAREHVSVLDKERKKFIRYPIPYETLRGMKEISLRTIDGRARYTASELAFHLLMRVGEYTINGKKCTHTLMCHQVLFDVDSNELIDVDQLRERWNSVTVLGVMVLFCGDKTHKKHNETYHYISAEGPSDSAERLLVCLLLEWIQISKVCMSDPFFTRYGEHPKGRRVLISRDISDFLKEAAINVGLEAGVFKPHSYRSGGAVELSHSGADAEVVNHAGRWVYKSHAGVTYRRREDRKIGGLTGIIGTKGSFSLKDMLSAKIVRHRWEKVVTIGSSLRS